MNGDLWSILLQCYLLRNIRQQRQNNENFTRRTYKRMKKWGHIASWTNPLITVNTTHWYEREALFYLSTKVNPYRILCHCARLTFILRYSYAFWRRSQIWKQNYVKDIVALMLLTEETMYILLTLHYNKIF